MFGIDGEIGISAVKLWVTVGVVAFILGFSLLGYLLPRYLIVRVLPAAFVIMGAGLGGVIAWSLLDHTPAWSLLDHTPAWSLLDHTSSRERVSTRQSLVVQAEQLKLQVLAPGSPLACLDGLVGEAVETACEKAMFSSPANVAAATSFVALRLELFAAMLAYDKRSTPDIDDLLRPLRRSLEADRFGFLAHVLAIRDGCTSEDCKALALLDDPGRIQVNLSAQTFEHYVAHYAEIWAKAPDGAHEAATGAVVDAIQPNAQPAHKIANIDFPTVASIPPVSIMNPEPTGPVSVGLAAAAGTKSGERRPRKSLASAPSPQAVAQPVTSNAAATEPIWPEPMPSPAGASAAAGEPVQIAPSSQPANTQ
jgi:hypothetical protein